MEIKDIINKQEWASFLEQCNDKTFLQSWNWGEFNEKMGSKIWRLGAYDNNKLIAIVFAYKILARRGTFIFIPHGPNFWDALSINDKKQVLELFLTHLGNIAKKEKASFVRVSPILDRNESNENIFTDFGFRDAPIHMHPEVTWELDLQPTEEELLMGMRKTTRYLVKQGEKNPDVEIIVSQNIEDLKLFWPVYMETAKRHHFTVFPEKYLKIELEAFLRDNEALLFLGKYKNEIVSVAIFVFWKGGSYYHHSGSLTKYNKIPVSYLLQWTAIKEAKRRGCKTYNFWGITPGMTTKNISKKSKHPWAGLSLFKMGFGGYAKEYIRTKDLIISNKYWLNYLIEKARKLKRGL